MDGTNSSANEQNKFVIVLAATNRIAFDIKLVIDQLQLNFDMIYKHICQFYFLYSKECLCSTFDNTYVCNNIKYAKWKIYSIYSGKVFVL